MTDAKKPWEQQFDGGASGAGAEPWKQDYGPDAADAPAAPRGLKGWGRDIAATAVKGAIAVPEALVGLADIPTGGRVGKFLENEGGAVGFRPKQAKEQVNEWHSDATKEAQRKFQEADGVLDKTAVALQNPSLIATSVGESLPSMGLGGVAARGLMAATKLGQMGAKGAVLAGAAGEGATMAGSQAEQIRQETNDGLLNPTQAGLAVATGLAGGAFGVAGGKVAQRLGIGDADTMLAQGIKGVDEQIAGTAARAAANPLVADAAVKSIPRKIIEGAIAEGFLEELPQSMAEQIFQNIALDKPWHEDLDSAAVMGVLSGGAMGAGAAGFHGFRSPAATPAGEPAPGVEPAAPPAEPAAEGAPQPNPGLARVSSEFAARLQALQEQEQGEAQVPQTAPPDGAAALAQQQAQAQAARDAEIAASRAVESPDDEILQSTGATAQRPSEAMGLRSGPEAGTLENAAAMSVDTGATAQVQDAAALAQAAEAAKKAKPANQKQEQPAKEQQDIDPQTGEISGVSGLAGWSDVDLSTAFRNAQSKEVRLELATELSRRRAAREEDALQAELRDEQAAENMPDVPDSAFARTQEDAGPVPKNIEIQGAQQQAAPGSQAEGANVATLAQLNRKKLAEMSDDELQQLSALLPADHSRQQKIQKAIQARAAQAQAAINEGAKTDGTQTPKAQQGGAQSAQAGAAKASTTAQQEPGIGLAGDTSGSDGQGVSNGGPQTVNHGAQASAPTAPQAQAQELDRQHRAKRIEDAGAQWTRMPAAERSALVGRLEGVKPVIAKNMPRAAWGDLNGDIQKKLADAMDGNPASEVGKSATPHKAVYEGSVEIAPPKKTPNDVKTLSEPEIRGKIDLFQMMLAEAEKDRRSRGLSQSQRDSLDQKIATRKGIIAEAEAELERRKSQAPALMQAAKDSGKLVMVTVGDKNPLEAANVAGVRAKWDGMTRKERLDVLAHAGLGTDTAGKSFDKIKPFGQGKITNSLQQLEKGEAAPKKKDTALGTNRNGFPLFEDANGVRYYVESGIRIQETVSMRPTAQGMQMARGELKPDFMTAEESAEAGKDEQVSVEGSPDGWRNTLMKTRAHAKSLIDAGKLDAQAAQAAWSDHDKLLALLDAQEKADAATQPEDAKGSSTKSDNYGSKNKLVSQSRADELRAKLREKAKNNMFGGLDTEMMAWGTELAVFHLEAGVRKFSDLVAAMASDLGTTPAKLKPYLRSWYNGARDMMEDHGLSIEGMDSPETVRAELNKLGEQNPAPQNEQKEASNERTTIQGDGPQALEPVAAGEGQGTQGNRATGADAAGSGDQRPAPGAGADGAGVQSPRSGGGGTERVHPAEAGDSGSLRKPRRVKKTKAAAAAEKAVGPDTRPVVAGEPASAPNIPAADFQITDELRLGQGGEVAKFNDNLAAIRTLKAIEDQNRRATPEEQALLARYVGWGGLANAFPDPLTGQYKAAWDARGKELRDLLDDAEYAAARRSTRNAHYTSKPVVQAMWRAVERLGFKGGLALETSMGVGNFLGLKPQGTPASFVGIEYDSLTARLAQALYPQATVLHSGFQDVPLADNAFALSIGNPPFGSESLRFQYKPELNGASIHNQFFRASMDALRPGGIQAMVVSRFLMDAKDKSSRLALAKQAKLVAAIRLPDTAFKENARTEVVTDIIILQKLTPAEQAEMALAIEAYQARGDKFGRKTEEQQALAAKVPAWVETADVADPLGGAPMTVNSYFRDNKANILGVMERSGSMQHGADLTVRLDDAASLESLLTQAVDRLPQNIQDFGADVIAASEKRHKSMSDALRISLAGQEVGHVQRTRDGAIERVVERETPEGGIEMGMQAITAQSPWSDQLFQDDQGRWYRNEVVKDEAGKPVKIVKPDGKVTRNNLTQRVTYATEAEVPDSLRLGKTGFERLSAAVGLRDSLKRQIVLETTDAAKGVMEANRKELAKRYEAFVAKFGPVNRPVNLSLLMSMPDGGLTAALEVAYTPAVTADRAKSSGLEVAPEVAKPAPILTERVVPKYEPATKAATASDALAITLSERGMVDMDRIAQLRGLTVEEAIAELQDGDKPLVFKDPESQAWETADAYLSGNVRRKLNAAKAARAEVNVKALEAVQPAAWGAEDVTVMLGSTWVPPKVYGDFAEHLMGGKAKVSFSAATNSFAVSVSGSTKAADWSAEGASAEYILGRLLNSQPVVVMYKDENGSLKRDNERTTLAQLKAKEISAEFMDWVFKDGERRTALVDLFNEKYNTRVVRQRDGSHLKLPGKVPDSIIGMRRHQKNVIWRGITDNSLLMDHAVGAGKTFAAIARAMERRRMGLSKKPMIVVPNHLIDQWASDVYRLYPGAKVLAAGKKDFKAQRRRRLFGKIATGDWDIVLVPHSSFGFIGIDPSTEQRFLQMEMDQALEAVRDAEEQAAEDGTDNGRRKPFGVKEAERLVEKIQTRMDKLNSGTKDRLLTFEQLGVDDLTVDEAHEFKNLYYSSRMTGVRGMGDKTGSRKANDLYNKVRVLQENPANSVTFLTGTPISNSAVEMYTVMRYLAPKQLQEMGLEHFDAWRAQFVEASAAFEPTESGSLKEVTRLGRSWSNMRSLMDLYYEFTDAVSLEDIQQWYSEDNGGKPFPVPKVKGGDRQLVNVQPTPAQEAMLKEVVAGFDDLPDIQDPYERNAERLRLMDRARKISLDVRAVDPRSTSTEENGKLAQASANIKRIYDATSADKGTQMVFLDRSVPKAKGDDKIIKEYDALIAKRDEALASGNDEAFQDVQESLDRYDANEIAELRNAQKGGWNAYQQIKDNLIAAGIPASEIRFIQEANNDEQKQALFDAVNSGKVRVLLGSSQRMGAGTNAQKRLVGLHHIDVTWKPSDIEQREGRIIRQGNELLAKYGPEFEVEILAYATERTVDAKMWDLNATKLKTINGIRKYSGAFSMDFEDADSVSMAEMAALASGNPLLLERVKTESEINMLELQERGFRRRMYGAQDAVQSAERTIARNPELIKQTQAREKMARERVAQAMENQAARRVSIEGQEYDNLRDAFGAMKQAIEAQQEGNPKARYSLMVDGQRLTNKESIEAAIGAALGDAALYEATIDGQTYTQHTAAARELAAKLTELTKGIERGQSRTKVVGKLLGFDLAIDATAFNGPSNNTMIDAAVSLVGEDGSTVHSISISEVPVNVSYVTANLRTPAAGLFGYIETMASSDGSGYMQRQLDRAIADLPGLRERLNQTFPKAEELAAKRERLRELVSLLEGTKAAPVAEGPMLGTGSSYIVSETLDTPVKWRLVTEGHIAFDNAKQKFETAEEAEAYGREVSGNEPTARVTQAQLKDSNYEGSAKRRPASAQDKAVMQAIAEGKSARDVLRVVASGSKDPFLRQVARLLLKSGITPNIEFGHIGKSKGNPIHGQYRGKTDTIAIAGSAEYAAERIFMHEAMHAATMRALAKPGLPKLQLQKLLEHVRKQKGAAGFYGTKNVDEFVAEVFTNPDFQAALRKMSAPSGSGAIKTAWDGFVRILRNILGLKNDPNNALSQALQLGVAAMREDMGLRQQGVRAEGAANYGADNFAALKASALEQLHQTLSHPGKVSIWDKTVGTMRNLAERVPQFKPVFEAAQRFIDDVSMLANDAADFAPRLMPRVESWADLKKKPITAADNKAVAKPLFEGTLMWARDLDGTPVTTEALNAKYRNMPAEEKAQMMLRTGKLDERVLKMWKGMPVESFEKAVASKFDSTILKPGVVWTQKELQTIFKLDEKQVGLYQEARAAIDRSLDMTARTDMLRAMGEQFAGMREAVLGQENLQDAFTLVVDTLQEEARANPDMADRLMDINNSVVKRYETATELMDKGYAPLSRFGKYTVDVVDQDGERQYFGMFESMREANQMAMKMRDVFKGAAVTQGTMSEQAFKLFQGITPESLEQFGSMLGLNGEGNEAQDKAFQAYLQLAKNNHSALKRLIHRKGIDGYSEDVGRVLASFVYSNARLGSGGLNAGTMETAVEGIPKEMGELRDVAMGLRSYIQDPQEEGQAVRGMLFAQYLGGSLASAFVNMTQPFQITMPWLSQYGGMAQAGKQMARALNDMRKSWMDKSFSYEPELAKALKEAEDDGTVSPQEIHQLMAQARGTGSLRTGDGTKLGDARAAAANNWERVKVAWGQPFALAEQFNRRSTFIASYRIAKVQGIADPAEFARKAVLETQFLYSKANKMRWARGAVGGTLMTFKTYSVSYLELMHRMWTQGGPEGKRAVGWAVAMLLLMGGAGGLPFMEDAEDLIDMIGQMMGYNLSTKQWRKEAMSDILGKEFAEFMEQGVSGLPGAPVDVSGRLGMGNLIPGTGLFLAKQNRERDLTEIAGPAGDLVTRGFSAGKSVLSGVLNADASEFSNAAMEIAPTAVRNAAKGIDMATSGIYKDTKGYKVMDVTLAEAASKFLGFQPKSVAEDGEASSFKQRTKSFYIQTSAEIKAQWAAAVFNKDDAALERVRDRLAAWNRNNPDLPITVKIPDIMKKVREMGKDREQRINDTAPKALRQQFREMAQDANR